MSLFKPELSCCYKSIIKQFSKEKIYKIQKNNGFNLHAWQKKYCVTKIVKNADLARNLYDSTASIVGQICDDVCMKHGILLRQIVPPIFLFFVEKKESEDNVILSVDYI